MEVIGTCDNTSVGGIVRDKEGRILMILRANYPYSYAPPAGHCDGKAYPVACFDEIFEETGLKILHVAPSPRIVSNPRQNKCRRGGEYHYWQVFEFNQAERPNMVLSGQLRPEPGGTKWAGWMTVEEIRCLAAKTQEYVRRWKLAEQTEELSHTTAIRESLGKEWESSPGLEVVWYEILQELKII